MVKRRARNPTCNYSCAIKPESRKHPHDYMCYIKEKKISFVTTKLMRPEQDELNTKCIQLYQKEVTDIY